MDTQKMNIWIKVTIIGLVIALWIELVFLSEGFFYQLAKLIIQGGIKCPM